MLIRHTLRRYLLLTLVVALAGCASVTDPTKDWTPERFYTEAHGKMDDSDWAGAIKYFESLESRYPYGRYAEQAQLEIAYAYYKDEEPALALAAADRFIRQHPTHPNVDYAYYLKGLVNFRGEKNFVYWLFGVNDDLSDRDPTAARDAYNAFRELTERFPGSRYAKDAAQRMAYLFDAQARYEVRVARYYYDRGAYVAAANRCKYALENFPRAPAAEDALGIQAKSYKRMGMDELLADTLRVLKTNFPNSRYLTEIAQTAKASG